MPSLMELETREAPAAVARLLDRELPALRALGRRLADLAPPVLVTCARGSSDHAAMFLKYMLEIAAGIPVASMGPSIASVYGTAPRLAGAAVVSISQSGRSPDLVAFQAAARRSGALTIAIVNTEDSPVAQQADVTIPLHAGPERSVAATKSFIASAAAAAALVACWTGDEALLAAVQNLPATLDRALACDWSPAEAALAAAPSCYMLGRGTSLAMACEAALKGKEVAARHAEAFSLAEVMHGPLRLVENGFPILAFVADDAAAHENRGALARLTEAGGRVFTPPAVATGHPLLDPLAMMPPFYLMAERLARTLGFDPDRPANLKKVTQTT
jgi:glucosamine--fructose-6-phosphate aminotransferase (isomerizing)